MAITLICPNLSCGRTIVVPSETRGRLVRCAHCNKPFMVPNLASSSENGAAAPKQQGEAANTKQ